MNRYSVKTGLGKWPFGCHDVGYKNVIFRNKNYKHVAFVL